MVQKPNKVVLVACSISCLVVYLFGRKSPHGNEIKEERSQCECKDWTKSVENDLLQQRNNLSKLLNLKQKEKGQMECKNVSRRMKISETGGWCKTESSSSYKIDMDLVKALADFLNGKYVGSFGEGGGLYREQLLQSGKLKGYDGYDGAPFCETTSKGHVKFLDLTLPQYGLPLYDWVISLEVAEHIPQQFESIYIDNVVRHAREGVILSWAKPGQQGFYHVNNKPFEYVKIILDKLGFSHNLVESQKLQTSASFFWFRDNTNVFQRKTPLSADSMKLFT